MKERTELEIWMNIRKNWTSSGSCLRGQQRNSPDYDEQGKGRKERKEVHLQEAAHWTNSSSLSSRHNRVCRTSLNGIVQEQCWALLQSNYQHLTFKVVEKEQHCTRRTLYPVLYQNTKEYCGFLLYNVRIVPVHCREATSLRLQGRWFSLVCKCLENAVKTSSKPDYLVSRVCLFVQVSGNSSEKILAVTNKTGNWVDW